VTLLIARQLVSELEIVATHLKVAIVPPLCPLDGSAYDFSRSAELIERAAAATRSWLDSGGLEHPEVPSELIPHSHEEP
jgi:NTE family protein